MYYLFGILIVLLCLFALIHWWRKKKALCHLACMTACEKYELLDSLVEPFGYQYVPEWDVFSSRTDAWQKNFGYGAIYDKAAPFFNMVFESLPVYFDYDGKTWLIQIWKGQYGICTGCEVGIYHADGLISEKERKRTIFHAVEDYERMELSTELWRKGQRIASLDGRHWWLTTFDVGTFSKPSQLSLEVSIQFPNREMKHAFYNALLDQGVNWHDTFSYCSTVYFHFPDCRPRPPLWKCIIRWFAQCINRFNCKLFRFVTRCCCTSCDRILYLYFILPFVCRHLLRLRHCRFKHRKKGGCHGMQ